MNQTQRMLQSIVENGRMGEEACDQLLEVTRNMEMREELMRERQFYANAAQEAELRLSAQGIKPRPKGAMARMGLWMGTQINTATDRSSAHIADIVIQGATMGIIEITKLRNSNPDADAEAQGIASRLIADQQAAIEKLKAFLREKDMVK